MIARTAREATVRIARPALTHVAAWALAAATVVALGSVMAWPGARATGGDSVPSPVSVPVFPTHGTIERLDPAMDGLLAPDAYMERLADGFNWSEGTTWLRGEKAVVFSDVPENKVYSRSR